MGLFLVWTYRIVRATSAFSNLQSLKLIRLRWVRCLAKDNHKRTSRLLNLSSMAYLTWSSLVQAQVLYSFKNLVIIMWKPGLSSKVLPGSPLVQRKWPQPSRIRSSSVFGRNFSEFFRTRNFFKPIPKFFAGDGFLFNAKNQQDSVTRFILEKVA